MATEYEVNTIASLIDLPALQAEGTTFINTFKVAGQPQFTSMVYDTVAYNDFVTLRNTLAPGTRPDDSYFTGLRVYYGLMANRIILLYVPVFMDHTGSVGGNDQFSVSPATLETATTIYTYSGGFNPINLITATSYVDAYRASILILRSTGNWTRFIAGDTMAADAKAGMIPYQEVDLLGNTNPDPFYVVCCARSYPPTGSDKHYISISKVDPGNALPTAGNVAANMANICPPNCAVVQVDQATRTLID
jgi:hypothetical protein